MSFLESTEAGAFRVLRLNHPPVNALTPALLDELVAAIAAANAEPQVQGIVITGAADHFSAGADVGLFRDLTTAEDAKHLCRLFQVALQKVEDSAKPVIAAVAGKMMGGALELAMACHIRVCDPRTLFSMPEVNLGINPGAGGTQRLPRLIGVEAALKMLLTGRPVNAAEALKLGLVSDSSGSPDWSGILSRATPRKTRDCIEKIADRAVNEAAFAQANKQIAGTRPELVAPALILEAVRVGVEESFEQGLQAEQELFARCMDSLATRNKIHVFFATRDTAKTPDLGDAPARPVERVAVIGMGSMGAGIAQAVLQAGLPVVVTDENPAALERGQERIRDSFRKQVEQGRMMPERLEATLARLSSSREPAEIAKADLIIEAVFEDVAVKQGVLGSVERLAGEQIVIASNTSTISLDLLAAPLRHPERLVGLHFFNPAHRMPLVEVIRRDGTAPGAVAAAIRFAKAIRKTPVLVWNREGFIVNRIFVPYLAEAFRLLEEGAEPGAIDQAMLAFGFPMGPVTLTDMAGVDILFHTANLLHQAFPRHGAAPQSTAMLVERGFVGQKRGAGVFLYAEGDRTARPNPALADILEASRQGRPARAFTAEEITQRLVMRMVSEAFYVLEEGIAQRESDIDAAMVLGTGFPDFRGGVVKYARDRGLKNVLDELEILTNQNGERFAPCNRIQELKG